MAANQIIIVSSPSGGGKSTINRMFVAKYPSFEIVTSFTTRDRREGEQNGREYFFVEKNEFESRLENNEMLEHAYVHGKYYGTSRKEVERIWNCGNTPILEIDVQGFESIQALINSDPSYSHWESTSVFILPPSFVVLSERLTARKSETDESLKKRLSAAKKEVANSASYDFHIVNDHLDEAFHCFTSALKENTYNDASAKAHLEQLCNEA